MDTNREGRASDAARSLQGAVKKGLAKGKRDAGTRSRKATALGTDATARSVTQVHALDITPHLRRFGLAAEAMELLESTTDPASIPIRLLDLEDGHAGAVVGSQAATLVVVDGHVLLSFHDETADSERAPQAVSGLIRRTKAATGRAELDESLWGDAPTNIEIQEASLQSKDRAFAARREVLESCVTRAKAAEWLGVSEPTISERIADGSLIAIKEGREWRLPTWQFDPDTERGFVPGLRDVQQCFPGNAISLSMWVLTENPTLGTAPVAALSDDRLDDVIAAIRGLGGSA